MKEIDRFLRSLRKARTLYALAQGLLEGLLALCVMWPIQVIAGRIWLEKHQGLLFFAVTTIVAVPMLTRTGKAIIEFWTKEGFLKMITGLKKHNLTPMPDDILNAWEFEGNKQAKSGQSCELSQLHVQKVSKTLQNVFPGSLAKPKGITKLVSATLLWAIFDVVGGVGLFQPVKPPTIALKPPQITNFSVTYYYPAYTSKPQKTINGPVIEAISGTRIKLTAESDTAIALGALNTKSGLEIPVQTTQKQLSTTFTLTQDDEYWFNLNHAFNSPRYPIYAASDNPPEIKLLAPQDDLACGFDAVIPLAYEVNDDFGIERVTLVYRRNNGSEQKKIIHRFTARTNEGVFDYRFNLASLGLEPGDTILLRLVAEDNNNVTGPGQTCSVTRTIKITSFEIEHARIVMAQKELEHKLVGIIADESNVLNMLSQAAPEWSKTANTQANANSRINSFKNDLESLIKRMEADPLTDISAISEYKGLARGSEELYQGSMSEVLKYIEKADAQATSEAVEETINILERMAILSQDSLRAANMRQAESYSDTLADYAKRITDSIESAKGSSGMNEEKLNEIFRLLSEAAGIAGNMQKQLREMPDEMPQEFINKQAIKEINPGSLNDISDKLAKALKEGDLDKALAIAREFLRQTQEMAKTIRESATDVSNLASYSPETSYKELGKLVNSLNEISQGQEKLLGQTAPFEDTRQKRIIKKQEKLLGNLRDKQKKTLESARDSSATGMMREILREFEEGRVVSSQMWLNEIIKMTTGTIRTSEMEILDSMKKSNNAGEDDLLFADSEKKNMTALADTQQELKKKAQALKYDLNKFSARTLALTPSAMRNLRQAIKEMEASESALKSANSSAAVLHEQLALEALKSGGESFKSAAERFSSAGQFGLDGTPGSQSQNGRKPSGIIRAITNGSVSSQPYHIPTADEYRPPKEFREELLEALKEKYPEKYKDLIQKYFKNLSK